MTAHNADKTTFPRMLLWALLMLVLLGASMLAQHIWPGLLIAVTFYKAHLMSLAGWGGYWLDRALFPYDRPHQHLDCEQWRFETPPMQPGDEAYLQVATNTYSMGMLRRAIVVAACLLCVGLGA